MQTYADISCVFIFVPVLGLVLLRKHTRISPFFLTLMCISLNVTHF
jgi:hypothetical protein